MAASSYVTYYARKSGAAYNVMGVPKAALEAPCVNGGRFGPEHIRVNAVRLDDQDAGRPGIGDFRYILIWTS